MQSLTSYFNEDNIQQKHYLFILKHITKYFQQQFIWHKGQPNQTTYSLIPRVFGGFIRDIIRDVKTPINDCDIFIKTTNKRIVLSLNIFRDIIINLNRYLTNELQGTYEVIAQEYQLKEHYEVFDTYGHYKVIIKAINTDEKYTFDISTQINSFGEKHITNMFSNLVDYTCNNLMCSVCVSLNDKLLFGDLELRIKEITTHSKQHYSLDEIIHHIISGIAIEYNYTDFIKKYSEYFCCQQRDEAHKRLFDIAAIRKDKLYKAGWKIQ